ncbi:hypothetical protein ETAA8_56300 [Anatilimnocola aggregata]|uniref:Uncharacterized protein n=1 Tax=Anatilimnocola aggregata TaxID=2528021 RepID=A0A517YJU2_9BACT|nr:hypothetical protein [Anatilimnocola aggregata]QDU30490.1 hypothetical protein ETAA8_56300 [Anatilimnocola aggregata]
MPNRLSWITCALMLTALCCGCYQQQPDRWAEADKASKQNPHAVVQESVAGNEFNRFFPQVETPWDIVFKQEKTGFAQASLQKSGRELAVLSVSDTTNNVEAAAKFKESTKSLGGMPIVEIGEQATAVLVADRFQVQVRSMDPEIGPAERQAWIEKFNLQAIGRIQPPAAAAK